MPPLQLRLRHARVVAVEAHEIGAQRGVVAGVAEHEGQGAAVALHAQHGHAMVHRPQGRELDTPVGREGGTALGGAELHGLSSLHRGADHADDLVLEHARVRADVPPLRVAEVVGHREHLVDDGAAVGVARVEEELLARETVAATRLARDAGPDAGGEAEQVERDEDDAPAPRVLQGQRLGMQRALDALRRRRTGREPRHPQGPARRDVDGGDARAPSRAPGRDLAPGEDDAAGKGAQEGAAINAHACPGIYLGTDRSGRAVASRVSNRRVRAAVRALRDCSSGPPKVAAFAAAA